MTMVTTRSQSKSGNHANNDILKVRHNDVSVKCKSVQTYPLLIKGKPVNIERDYCYPVKFTRCAGLVQIEDIWHEKREAYIKVNFFVTPYQLHGTEKCQNYGEDEILLNEHNLLLSSQQFRHCYRHVLSNTLKTAGTNIFTEDDINVITINSTEYISLKHPSQKLSTNPSATKFIKTIMTDFNVDHDSRNDDVNHKNSRRKLGIRVVDYKKYCEIRKWKKALETGVLMKTQTALDIGLLQEQPTKIFFATGEQFACDNMVENAGSFTTLKGERNHKRKISTDKEMDMIDDQMYKKFKHVPVLTMYKNE